MVEFTISGTRKRAAMLRRRSGVYTEDGEGPSRRLKGGTSPSSSYIGAGGRSCELSVKKGSKDTASSPAAWLCGLAGAAVAPVVAAGAAGAAGVAGAAAALAAAAALQMERCEGQSIFWQAGLQYATCLHPEQVFAGDSESQLAHFAGIPTGRDQNERPKRHHKVWVVWSRVEGCYAISTGMGDANATSLALCASLSRTCCESHQRVTRQRRTHLLRVADGPRRLQPDACCNVGKNQHRYDFVPTYASTVI